MGVCCVMEVDRKEQRPEGKREEAKPMSLQRALQLEGTASAKVLRWWFDMSEEQ